MGRVKKVVYVMTSLAHKRVFESFVGRKDLDQIVIGPTSKITSGIVPEDYSDFRIKNRITYKSINDLQGIINKIDPDVYVEASLPIAVKLKKRCKKVYVSHGMVGSHVINLIKQTGMPTKAWKGCDLYCGASDGFEKWIRFVSGPNAKVLKNALPQLDILHDQQYYESYKSRVLDRTKNPNPDKVVLFVGFCCKDRLDFNPHNEDYFRTTIELERIAREKNWLVMIKPRHTYNKMKEFLRTHKWGPKYLKKYESIQGSKHLHFITTTGHIYRYFFADQIIINGTSTVEIEACAIQKPLFIVNTKTSEDPFGTIKLGAAQRISRMDDVERYLCSSVNMEAGQKRVIEGHGISFDGEMHRRVQDYIRNIL